MITTSPTETTGEKASQRWTFVEWREGLPESNRPTEFWDGESILSPSPSFYHQQIVDRFHDALKAWVRPRGLGKTCASLIDMVLAERRAVQPDVLFVGRERLGIIGDVVNGSADLVAEVISPESRRRDRFDKHDLYEQHGVQDYWMLDPEASTVEVFYLEDGQYRLVGRWGPGETAVARLLAGFSVPVAGMFSGE